MGKELKRINLLGGSLNNVLSVENLERARIFVVYNIFIYNVYKHTNNIGMGNKNNFMYLFIFGYKYRGGRMVDEQFAGWLAVFCVQTG
jgi:hypothetical protein